MKLYPIRGAVGFFVLSALVGIVPAAQSHSCSTAKTAGKYAFTLTGALILPTGTVPVAAVGQAVLDPDGGVSGTESRSLGGDFGDETFIGTFSINSDCSGTTTLNFYEGGQLVRTSVLSLIVDENNQEVRMVQKSLTLPNGANLPVVITVDAREMRREDEK
jgi:hypothetical protein